MYCIQHKLLPSKSLVKQINNFHCIYLFVKKLRIILMLLIAQFDHLTLMKNAPEFILL